VIWQGEIDLARIDDPYDPEFIHLDAEWPNPSGSPHIGNFAVNPWTGDAFDADGCKRLSTPLIRKMQKAIRKRSALSAKEYGALRAKKPGCSVD
jgi:hypothetical protein